MPYSAQSLLKVFYYCFVFFLFLIVVLIAQYYYNFKSYYFPMRKEKKLSYSCMVGYTTETGTQDGRITCTANGWSPVPRCYSELALLISSLLLAENFSKMYFKIHEKLQYKCNPGYHTPSGGTEDTVQCQPEGWSSQPSCTKKFAQQVLRLNETLLYKCDEGYRTAGGNTTEEAVCLTRGWSLTPNCNCASPPVVKNGVVLGPLLTSYKNGSSVEYGCQHYHFLDGPRTVYCQQGNWTEPPTCFEPCTLNVTDMNSNNIELKWRQEELIFLHGDLIEFECKQGYSFLQTTILSPGRTQCNQGRLQYPKCIMQGKPTLFYYLFN
uniref:Coagulation factor XIII B chain n=1 Tax=Strigops habroptila TaxID=2489341 RepID=A0A672U9U0_STRHB